MKLKEVYDLWISAKKRQVKKSTAYCYVQIYKNIIEPVFSDSEIETLNKKVLVPFLFSILDSGKSKKYCSDILIVLKMIIRFAGDELEQDIPDTTWKIVWPTKNLDAPKTIEAYTEQECRKITDYILANPSPRNFAILLTLSTGIRIGELCALQWNDFDFTNKVVNINKSLERIYYADTKTTEVVIGPPKTISSNRTIPLSKLVYKIAKKFSEVCNPEYYVCSCSQNFVEPRTFRTYYINFILKKVKLPRCIKFHGLRHTFASTLIANKIDAKTVSVLLGHSDISTTLNVYVHPSDDVKRKAVNSGIKKLFR